MTDQELFDRCLRSFVPPRPIDIHAHLYRRQDAALPLADDLQTDDGDASLNAYRRNLAAWMGDAAPQGGLFFAFPTRDSNLAAANQFLIDQVAQSDGLSRGLLLVRPHDDPAPAEALVQQHRLAGFKVYHLYADRADTFQATIGEFLPDWAWELADQHSLLIMLHLVRARALADPENQAYRLDYARRFPNARLILAHAARGFCGAHTVEGIDSLRGVPNVYFDTSAICEPAPLEAILRAFGPSRLLFGTDFPVSEMRGKCVSVGDGFCWLDSRNFDWRESPFAQPVRVGLESLLAVKQACQTLRLNDSDVERIFSGGAQELLGFGPRPQPQVQEIYTRAKQIIPGGTQLLSKRPEMYAPERWPAYYREARGCEVIDLDGRRLTDMTTSGIGSCLLGYADPEVTNAVVRRVQLGSMCTLNSSEEFELAEQLIAIHPWAEQVRYCRTGGEAMAVAVRIARAATRRDRIAFCGYHGWSDWYLAAELAEGSRDQLKEHLLPGLEPLGVPKGLAGTALPFRYNHIDELATIVRQHGSQLAAVVMEPTRSLDPAPDFLEDVRQLCDDCGAALVFDEITAGWRMHLGGVHLKYGIHPDIAVFGKAIGSGHPLSAIIGRAQVMEAAQATFISSTYWTEGVGPTAGLATLRKFQQIDVPAHVESIGDAFRTRWEALGHEHGVSARATGHASLLHLSFDHPQAAALGTLFTVRMLQRGYLTGSSFYPSLSHTEHHLENYFVSAEPVFSELAQAIREEDILRRLGSPIRHRGLTRLN